jgi:transposase
MKSNQESKKQIRHFSEDFKKEKVKYIEEGISTVSQIAREYDVTRTCIYKWIKKYSSKYQKAERVVIEKESEEVKRKKVVAKVAELEQMLGQKQMEIEYLKKVIELGTELTGVDIKKKFDSES